MLKVENSAAWFIVDTNDRNVARREARKEWGSRPVSITKATKEDIDYFQKMKGNDAVKF